VIIGVDLGLDGGIAWLAKGIRAAQPMPTLEAKKGRRHDVAGLREMLLAYDDQVALVIAEQLHAVPRSMGGSASSFSRGYALGLLEGLCASEGLPLQLVTPRAWQKVMLAGTPSGDTKARSIQACGRLFPGVPLVPPGKRKAHDGIADALLLASYGARLLGERAA
jgi:RNase H-fold protein (predicted Holliday junction resolvase)